MIGTTLAHFRIVSPLGKGGMGEVYRATDGKLGRDVAIKILPAHWADDSERAARFEREARTLAAIQHPNIASIYGFEQDGAQRFLVMELVEGDDLSLRIAQGPIPVDEALAIAHQIASGLEAAHEKGVVHRDLKPANIKVAADGRAKILDFGLAAVLAEARDEVDLEHSPTISAGITGKGVILGTAAYMSPEQARGKEVDRRTDLWAFGCVFYEMLTGARIFGGETLSDSIGAILHKELDLAKLPRETPPAIAHLITRCLIKDPNKRLRDAGDARSEIELARDGSSTGLHVLPSHAFERPGRRSRLAWPWLAGGLTLGLAIGALGWRAIAPEPAPPQLRKLDLGVAISLRSEGGVFAALAPDESKVAYTNLGRLWVQDLDQLTPRPVEGAENASNPFWSPDSQQIGYLTDRGLWRIAATGGRPVQLTAFSTPPVGGARASWGDDDQIVYSMGSSGIWQISGRGGQPRELVAVEADEGDHHDPLALPDGRGVLFASHRNDGAAYRLDHFEDGVRRTVWTSPDREEALHDPAFDPVGYILLERTSAQVTGGVWAIPVDPKSITVTAEPFLVAESASYPSVGRRGTLGFVAGQSGSGGNQQFAWYDRSGQKVGTIGGRFQGISSATLSPDGRRIAFRASDPETGQMDLRIVDVDRGTQIRLTDDVDVEFGPHWMGGSEELSFVPFRVGMRVREFGTARIYADGGSAPRPLLENLAIFAFLPNGPEAICIQAASPDSVPITPTLPFRVGLVDVGSDESPRWILEPARNTFPAAVSPDSRWLLLTEATTVEGPSRVVAVQLPDGGRRWLVTPGRGRDPIWSPAGDRIYYMDGLRVMEISFEVANGQPRLGRPEFLFEIPPQPTGPFVDPPDVQIAPDGNRFLVIDYVEDAANLEPRVKLVEHWASEFR